ncbi:MAG: LysE family translocator [Thermoplasmataceae archaeon]
MASQSLLLLAGLGILLGVSLAAPPGPVTSVLLQRATKSMMAGALVGFGAMSADLILMVITLTIGFEIEFGEFIRILYVVGAAFFLYLSYSIIKNAHSDQPILRHGSPRDMSGSGYLLGLSIGLINPMQIGWWITAGLGMYKKFGLIPMIFIFVGILFWVLFLAEFVWRLNKKYEKGINTAVRIFSVVSLTTFGIVFLLSSFGINIGV